MTAICTSLIIDCVIDCVLLRCQMYSPGIDLHIIQLQQVELIRLSLIHLLCIVILAIYYFTEITGYHITFRVSLFIYFVVFVCSFIYCRYIFFSSSTLLCCPAFWSFPSFLYARPVPAALTEYRHLLARSIIHCASLLALILSTKFKLSWSMLILFSLWLFIYY